MMAHWNYSLTLRSPEQAPSRNQVIHTTTSYINLTRTSTTSKVSSHTCVMAFCYFIIALVFLCAFLHIRQRHKRRVLWTTASLSTPGANTQSIGNRELDNENCGCPTRIAIQPTSIPQLSALADSASEPSS
ncbi:hypothetical protein BD410DRAFT_295098 [Rickenella mellea]|uniref:Uncharacterized protein n=1 Tax=Rickenella mellea TaxID=50990 RepID=A0A4Y7Q2I6_9AGAM|nr:hypothetical protein BD410DRAFT_295098 [Rickenella mellea]